MLKNKKILFAVAIAAITMISACLLLIGFMQPMRTTFYVFRENYKAGTTITSSMLTPVQADSRIVLAGGTADSELYFITNKNLAENIKAGDVLRVDVKQGEAMLISHIASQGNNEVEVKMSPNSVAVTIPVSNITGITADLKSESHVNVYVSYDSGETSLLLENIRVLSVAKNETELEGVTLELTKDQAPIVIEAMNLGDLYLGLVNADGYMYG